MNNKAKSIQALQLQQNIKAQGQYVNKDKNSGTFMLKMNLYQDLHLFINSIKRVRMLCKQLFRLSDFP